MTYYFVTLIKFIQWSHEHSNVPLWLNYKHCLCQYWAPILLALINVNDPWCPQRLSRHHPQLINMIGTQYLRNSYPRKFIGTANAYVYKVLPSLHPSKKNSIKFKVRYCGRLNKNSMFFFIYHSTIIISTWIIGLKFHNHESP